MVYHVMKLTIEHVKSNISQEIETIHYFSDGCTGYKNCKHFINVCHHEEDFTMKCTWSFFVTTHCKSPCDCIGGTVKRLTSIASLHRTTNNHILAASAMFDFCRNEIIGISFYSISKKSNMIIRREMGQIYTIAKALPGTRSYHNFTPISNTKIATKVVSEQLEYSFVLISKLIKLLRNACL